MNLIDIGVMNHDVYVRLTGEPARELQAIHDATWKLKGPKTPDFRRDPEPSRKLTAIAPSMARVIKTDIDQQTTKKVLLEDIAAAKKSVHLAIYEFGDQDVVTALALCHPEVDFRLIINGRESISTVGARTLKDVVAALLGDDVAEGLGPVDYANETGAYDELAAYLKKRRR